MKHLKKFEEFDLHTISTAWHTLPGLAQYGIVSLALSILGSYPQYRRNYNRIHSEVSKIEKDGENINMFDTRGNVILIFNPSKKTLQVIPKDQGRLDITQPIKLTRQFIDKKFSKPTKLSDVDFKKFNDGVLFLEKIQDEIPEILQDVRDNGIDVDISHVDIAKGDFMLALKNISGEIEDSIYEMVGRIEDMIGTDLSIPSNVTTSVTKKHFGSIIKPYRWISNNNQFIIKDGDDLKYCDMDGKNLSDVPKKKNPGILTRNFVAYLYFKKRA